MAIESDFQIKPFKFVLTKFLMPKITGVECALKIRRNFALATKGTGFSDLSPNIIFTCDES